MSNTGGKQEEDKNTKEEDKNTKKEPKKNSGGLDSSDEEDEGVVTEIQTTEFGDYNTWAEN